MRCPLTLRKLSNLPKRKIKILGLLLASAPLALVSAAELIPTAPGMSWRYNMIQEVGKGLRVPDSKTDADGKIRRSVLYRIAGMENVDGKELLKFEMHRAGVVTTQTCFPWTNMASFVWHALIWTVDSSSLIRRKQ